MNRSVLYGMGIGVVIMAVLFFVGNALLGPPPSPSPSARPSFTARPSTTATHPSPTPADTSIQATAIVVPQRSADLSLSVSGIVDQIYVHEHDEVSAGELILRLDQTTYLAAVSAAQADLDHAEAVAAKAQLTVDDMPADATPGQIASAQAELKLAQADRDVASSRVNEATVALRQTELRAPFDGTLAAINVEKGEQSVAGQPVATIGDLSGWVIETTDLSELEVVRVAVGDPATVTFEALPGLVLTGHVDRIQVRGTGDAGNVVFAVAIKPDVHNPDLRWNMTATVRITPSE